jgi:hypothetical protein
VRRQHAAAGHLQRVLRGRYVRQQTERQRQEGEQRLRRDRLRLAQMAEARARLTAPCRHSVHRTTTNQRVLREYTGGWLQCADETPPTAGAGPPRGRQHAAVYYFNARTGETRWDAPPALAKLREGRHAGRRAPLHEVGNAEQVGAAEEPER